MKFVQKKTLFITAALLICLIFSFTDEYRVLAETNEGSNKVDVVFVIDASKSMNTSDPQGLSSEAMKMFIDMCHASGDKGGMVAYSGGVIREYTLKYMNSESDKSSLKNTLTGLERGNWTDIGIGLNRAVSILKDGHDNNNRPIVILLSDGKNDPQRDKKASQDDLTAALNEAKAQHFPVYTIGLNADGTVDKNQLEAISKETNAKSFITNNASELPRILRETFADNSRLKILQDETIVGNDKFQDVKISIPDSNVVEANISILSSKPVELRLKDAKGKDVKLPSEKILYTKSNNYSMVKLISPEKGDWLLSVKGTTGDKLDISLISNYDLKAGIKLDPDSNLHKGDKVKITAHLESNGVKLEDMALYSTLKSTAYINNLDNSETKELPMKLEGDSFAVEFSIPDDNNYNIKAKIEGPGFIRESEVKNIIVTNRIPVMSEKIKGLVLWNKQLKEINLTDYFTDGDNDKLSYSVSSNDISPLNLKISDNILRIQGGKYGRNTITITVDDGKGGKVSTYLVVKIYPVFYIATGIGALLLLVLLIICIRNLIDRSTNYSSSHLIEYSQKYKTRKSSRGNFSTQDILNLNLGTIKLKELKKINLVDLDLSTEEKHDIITKLSILKRIDQCSIIYERGICEEIHSLNEDDRTELFDTLKRLYLDRKEEFFKASYLTYNYESISAENFNIIQVLRDIPTDYDSVDAVIKHIMSAKGSSGVIRYLNHLSKYQEDYGLENTYFEKVLSALISDHSLGRRSVYRKLNKELIKIIKNIPKPDVTAQQPKPPVAY